MQWRLAGESMTEGNGAWRPDVTSTTEASGSAGRQQD